MPRSVLKQASILQDRDGYDYANPRVNIVYNAIKAGYRYIDGAWDYKNSKEAGLGVKQAIKEGIVKREDLFICTKLWNNYHKYKHACEMLDLELEAWGLEYFDLVLIHFPIALEFIPFAELRYPTFWRDRDQKILAHGDKVPTSEAWKALEDWGDDGNKIRNLGLSNFSAQLIYDVNSYAKTPVSVLQIEHHPYLTQPELVKMAQENNIAVIAYSSFGGQSHGVIVKPLLEHPDIVTIAKAHGKTPAQVLLRWVHYPYVFSS
ncbi:NADP-dependent oxidoreductase domain-containing protein [Nemania sp. FL0916]|nr:NADP-dependent oxidoreductase domain-containing protein [Nemania sp. FL0916]